VVEDARQRCDQSSVICGYLTKSFQARVRVRGGGSALARSTGALVGWPFNIDLLRAFLFGGLALCPSLFAKQFLLEKRKAKPTIGEWLWVVLFCWVFLVACSVALGLGAVAILLFVNHGIIFHRSCARVRAFVCWWLLSSAGGQLSVGATL
jgi:hypothetical protein